MVKHFVNKSIVDLSITQKQTKEEIIKEKKAFYYKKRIDLYQKQHDLNAQLKQTMKHDPITSKKILINIVHCLMKDPAKSKVLDRIKNEVDEMINDFLKNPEIIQKMSMIAIHDSSTSIHVTNTFLLAFLFGYDQQMPIDHIREMCLSAMLHDIGKITTPDYILQAPRKLTTEEFKIIMLHPVAGYNLLINSNLSDDVKFVSLEHHEFIDGSGYPYGITNPRYMSRVITIIDIFEAMTNWRPYKDPKEIIETLGIMKDELVEPGKIDKEIFQKFMYITVNMNKYL